MDEDEDPAPRVPGPREGGREHPVHPVVPAPRRAPTLESLARPAGTVATLTGRGTSAEDDRAPSTALAVPARRSGAIALRDDSLPSRLRARGREGARVVARLGGAAVDGLRALIEGLAPAPSPAEGPRR